MGKALACLILFYLAQCISSMSNGFSLKLVQKHTTISPFYQPNMSGFERFKLDVEMKQNIHFKESKLSSLNTTIHRYPLKSHLHYFTVEVGIGNPMVQKTLVFDPFSSFTWIQCNPCLKCFKQDKPIFDIKKSSSYKKVSILSPVSKMFYRGLTKCSFRQKYNGGYFASGMAGIENFAFQTATGGTNHLAFGCGTKTNIDYFPPTINGVLGFNRARSSFASQLQTQIKSRFSYCVPPIFETNTTKGYSYVKFGDEAIMRNKDIQSAPFLPKVTSYKVSVFGFSINGDKLGKHVRTPYAGYVIDLNTPFTNLDPELFLIVERKLGEHFAKFGVSRVRTKLPPGMESLKCCYSHPSGFRHFPDMKFHFLASDFHIPPENLFVHVPKSNISCLAMVRGCRFVEAMNCEFFLGVYQQQNMRFMFDLIKNEVSFATENC